MPASITERVTENSPSVVTVPEISPVAESMLRPGGRPVALTRAKELPPLVITWKLKGLPVRPVTLVTFMITGPAAGSGWTVRTMVALVVPAELEALSPTSNVPSTVGLPTMASRVESKVNPGGKVLSSTMNVEQRLGASLWAEFLMSLAVEHEDAFKLVDLFCGEIISALR
jgi:hypothetical protein